MDAKYKNDRDQAFLDSTGNALNLTVNELADVLKPSSPVLTILLEPGRESSPLHRVN